MPHNMIGAEVVPLSGKSNEAAAMLQKLGFKVLHIGNTSVSVQGQKSLWKKHFSVSFESKSKQQHSFSPQGKVTYPVPKQDSVTIPADLKELITSVAFVVPPEFF